MVRSRGEQRNELHTTCIKALSKLMLMLVKTGPDVRVSVRRALGGTDLGQLRDAVEREFLTLDEHEQSVRSVMAKMESGFIRRLAEFQHD